MNAKAGLAALLLACGALALPAAYAASTMYKVRLKDGSILLTDTPPPDAQVLEKIEPGSRPSSAAPLPAPSPQRQSDVDMRIQARQADLERAQQQVDEAERALAQARRALEEGRDPQESEVRANRGGGARVMPQYEERVRKLEKAVEQAEQRLRRAYDQRNAAR
jgi:hypothetical protein